MKLSADCFGYIELHFNIISLRKIKFAIFQPQRKNQRCKRLMPTLHESILLARSRPIFCSSHCIFKYRASPHFFFPLGEQVATCYWRRFPLRAKSPGSGGRKNPHRNILYVSIESRGPRLISFPCPL